MHAAARGRLAHHYAYENILFDHCFVDMFSEQAGNLEIIEDMRTSISPNASGADRTCRARMRIALAFGVR